MAASAGKAGALYPSRAPHVTAALRESMDEARLTQTEAARKLGVSHGVISMLLSGYQGSMGLRSMSDEQPLAFRLADLCGRKAKRRLVIAIKQDMDQFTETELFSMKAKLTAMSIRDEVGKALDDWARISRQPAR